MTAAPSRHEDFQSSYRTETICHHRSLLVSIQVKRLTVVSAGRFYRFEHIVSYSSGKVVAKSDGHVPILQEKNNLSRSSYFWKNCSVFLTTVESPTTKLWCQYP